MSPYLPHSREYLGLSTALAHICLQAGRINPLSRYLLRRLVFVPVCTTRGSARKETCPFTSESSGPQLALDLTHFDAMDAQEKLPRVPKDIKFRVLIIGRANAGKTSILQRVCDTTESPEIYSVDSWGYRERVRPRP
jgi:hypothetical protein